LFGPCRAEARPTKGGQFPRHLLSSTVLVAILLTQLLTGCASPPRAVEPHLQKQALTAETDGGRRYARGDYVGAKPHFDQAARLYRSLDKLEAAERNQLNAARAELALGRPEAALRRVADVAEPVLLIEALSITTQAHLAWGALPAAQETLSRALAICPPVCTEHASLRLLQSRLFLLERKPAEALAHAEAGLQALQGKDELRETANAWRLIANATLATGDTARALASAQSALALDRQLGLPEKIARDWLLIGDILQHTGQQVLVSADKELPVTNATSAYRRALVVAQAAGRDDVAKLASEALTKIKGQTQ